MVFAKLITSGLRAVGQKFSGKASNLITEAGFRYAGKWKSPLVSFHPNDFKGPMTNEILQNLAYVRKSGCSIAKPWSSMTFPERLSKARLSAYKPTSGDIFMGYLGSQSHFVDDGVLIVPQRLPKK